MAIEMLSFPSKYGDFHIFFGVFTRGQLIGLREKIQEHPIFHGKIYSFLMFPVDFLLSQPIEEGSSGISRSHGGS